MATARKPSTPKTSADILKDIAAAKARLALLEKQLYSEELDTLIKGTCIVADFARIQARVKDIKDVAILAAIGAAVGIKRLELKQTEPAKRKPVDPSAPKKPRKPKVQPA